MALGILEPKVEHVPGTVYVYESEQRHAELLEGAQHLKKDKTGRIILVPQASNDPNDPLVRGFPHHLRPTLTPLPELASLATRRNPRHPVLRVLPSNHSVSSASGRFCHTCNHLQDHISGCGLAHSLPPLRSRCSRVVIRRIGKSMGQEASVPLWSTAHDCKFGMGRL